MSSIPPGAPVEYLGDEQPPTPRKKRRTALVVAATAGVVAIAGAGAFAVVQFMSAGPAPATAVPADALAYVAVDLDPSGSQKIEAVKTLRKFPAIRDELGLDAGDDLRRWLYDSITAEEPCKDLDFEDDIDSWLGNKLAVATMQGDDEPVLAFVLQVKDQKLAEQGVAAIADCAGEDVPGTAFLEDYMVVAETDDIAAGLVADAEKASLADDEDYGRWIDEAGGSGIIEAYVSADAPKYLSDTLGFPAPDDLTGLDEGSSSSTSNAVAPLTSSPPRMPDVDEAFADFEGAAMVVRFDGGALEVELAAGGLPGKLPEGGDSGLADLPATTALALGFAVSDTAVQDVLDSFTQASGLTQDQVDSGLAEAEAATGLDLPEDLQTLLGDGFSVAVDSSADLGGMTSGADVDPAEVPVGVRIVGDPDEITGVLDKVQAALGQELGPIVVEKGDGAVAIGLDEDYVTTLAEDGALGEQDRFRTALSDLDGSTGGVYVDFDAGDWLTGLVADEPDSEKLQANLEPLSTFGITGSVEDDVAHATMRLSTD